MRGEADPDGKVIVAWLDTGCANKISAADFKFVVASEADLAFEDDAVSSEQLARLGAVAKGGERTTGLTGTLAEWWAGMDGGRRRETVAAALLPVLKELILKVTPLKDRQEMQNFIAEAHMNEEFLLKEFLPGIYLLLADPLLFGNKVDPAALACVYWASLDPSTDAPKRNAVLKVAARASNHQAGTALSAVDLANDDGGSSLAVAAVTGEVGCLQALLKCDAAANATDRAPGWRVLMHAAAGGHVGCTEALLAHETTLSVGPQSALMDRGAEHGALWAVAHSGKNTDSHVACAERVLSHMKKTCTGDAGISAQKKWAMLEAAQRGGVESCEIVAWCRRRGLVRQRVRALQA
eukprot:SAG11_NODE_1472_length_4841_cov_2.468157_4_plen_352_part_00